MCTEDEYNRLPLVSYQSETNHWLVFYLGAKQIDEAVSDSDTEDAVRETESAAESLEGKVEDEKETDPTESLQEVAKLQKAKNLPLKHQRQSQHLPKPRRQNQIRASLLLQRLHRLQHHRRLHRVQKLQKQRHQRQQHIHMHGSCDICCSS